MTVAQPIPGTYASGGGWVVDPSSSDLPVPISSTSDHGNFGFTVSLDKDGRARGHSVYVFRGADGYVYLVKSTSFVGRATVIAVDPATGLQVAGIGGGAFTIRVDVTDAAASDGRDTFALAVYAQDGSLYHRVGTPSAQLPLQGGQIKVHTG